VRPSAERALYTEFGKLDLEGNRMNKVRSTLIISALTGMLSLAAFWTTAAQADSRHNFTLEVAMDSSTGGINPNAPDFADWGRAFVGVFNGNIYPKGTLRRGDDGFDPTSDGEIGTWRCHFTALNNVAFGTGNSETLDFPLTGAVTYYFQLRPTGYDRAESMLMVMGLNSHTADDADNVSRVLTVVGGTGRFAGATGEVRERVLGRNTSGARNLRFRFRLQGVKGRHDYRRFDHDDDD